MAEAIVKEKHKYEQKISDYAVRSVCLFSTTPIVQAYARDLQNAREEVKRLQAKCDRQAKKLKSR